VEALNTPRLLRADDKLLGFDCGVPALNDWLSSRAWVNHVSGASRCYVVAESDGIAGYYSLSASSLEHAQATGKIRRNMPNPIPVAILGRLAVDIAHQGRGVGAAMLLDALQRTQAIADSIGIRAILLKAKDERAARFYMRFNFVPSPQDPLILMQLV
jgi:GNAT superfamily N-acetyltransferase